MSELCEEIGAAAQWDQAHNVCVFVHPLLFLANRIGDEGARALAECLKQNTTLTSLDLQRMSELCEAMGAAAQ